MNSNVKQSIFSYLKPLLLIFTIIVLLASCTEDEEKFVTEPVEVAYVSIYHASPDAPDFDIIVDDRVINARPFDYSSHSGYLNFLTGDRTIRFNATNADNALIDTTFTFEQGKAYSIFAADRVSRIEALLVEDSAASPSANKAMVRFVNLSPDAASFDVSSPEWSAPLFTGQSFKEASAFKEVDARRYTFEVRNAGEEQALVSAVNIDIQPGRYYTIISRGFSTPPAGNTNGLSVEVIE